MNYYGETENEGLFLISVRSNPINPNTIDKNVSSRLLTIDEDEDQQFVRAIIR